MMLQLRERINREEIEEAHMEAAMEIMANAEEYGELVVSNVMINYAAEPGIPNRHTRRQQEKLCHWMKILTINYAAELGIPNRLTPEDNKKNNVSLDEDTEEEKEQTEVEPTEYMPKEPACELSKKRKVYT